jgi:hypothetical protein
MKLIFHQEFFNVHLIEEGKTYVFEADLCL